MHSIRTRILILALVCVVISNVVVIFVGIIGSSNTVNTESDLVIQQLVKDKGQVVDEQLHRVEQSVTILQEYIARDVAETPTMWQDTTALNAHIDKVHSLASMAIKDTDGAVSVYYHLVPQIGSGNSGLYIVKSGEEYADYPVSDVSEYASGEDPENDWYSLPLEERKAVWLSPYKSEALNKRVISYVTPIIYGDQQIGVVGMDLTFEQILTQINGVRGYDGSYAILMGADGSLVYHPDYQSGLSAQEFAQKNEKISELFMKYRNGEKVVSYRWNAEARKVVFRKLGNGMYLGISVSLKEVRKPARVFAFVAIVIVAGVILLAFLLTDRVAGYIVKPLEELTEVAQKLAGGDLDVNIRCQSHDEVEVLAGCIQKTADELKKYVNSLNDFARTDALTAVHNKAAYEEQIKTLTNDIELGKARFSVAVLDVNSLKHMNDTYGHEAGDMWIIGAATAMERAFGRSRVYRTGGDEFTVIFEPKGRKHFDRMLTEFYKEIDRFNRRDDKIYKEQLQVACGLADFDEKIDNAFADVFRRADNEMYENKKYLKGLA